MIVVLGMDQLLLSNWSGGPPLWRRRQSLRSATDCGLPWSVGDTGRHFVKGLGRLNPKATCQRDIHWCPARPASIATRQSLVPEHSATGGTNLQRPGCVWVRVPIHLRGTTNPCVCFPCPTKEEPSAFPRREDRLYFESTRNAVKVFPSGL